MQFWLYLFLFIINLNIFAHENINENWEEECEEICGVYDEDYFFTKAVNSLEHALFLAGLDISRNEGRLYPLKGLCVPDFDIKTIDDEFNWGSRRFWKAGSGSVDFTDNISAFAYIRNHYSKNSIDSFLSNQPYKKLKNGGRIFLENWHHKDEKTFVFFKDYSVIPRAFAAIKEDCKRYCLDNISFCQRRLQDMENGKSFFSKEPRVFSIPYYSTKNFYQKIQGYKKQFQKDLKYVEKEEKKAFDYCKKSLDLCLQYHKNPIAHYERGLFYFLEGNSYDALKHLRWALDKTNTQNLKKIESKAQLLKGQLESELGLYAEAAISLNEAIQKDPSNKEAYFERATLYFGQKKYDLSIKDFLKSDVKNTPIEAKDSLTLDFAKGLTIGTAKGIGEGLAGFIPSLLSSINGIGHGLWSFAASPYECSKELVTACQDCFQFLKESSSTKLLTAVIPEFKEMVGASEELSENKKGEIFGYVIGKYGTDILAFTGSVKAIKTYRNLKKANAAFLLGKFSKRSKETEAIQAAAAAWNKKHLAAIKKFKKGEKLLKPYKGQYLQEIQARKILHQAGFKTFSKPEGIPENFRIKLSNDGGGMKYVHPEHTHESIRMMPGNPHSSNPCQQKPYIIHIRGGKALNKWGNKVLSDTSEAHISLNEYIYIPEK